MEGQGLVRLITQLNRSLIDSTFFENNKFIQKLFRLARKNKRRIFLAEGNDKRVLEAGVFCANQNLARVEVLGSKKKISQVAKKNDFSLDKVTILDDSKIDYSPYEKIISNLKDKQKKFISENQNPALILSSLKLLNGEVDGVVAGAVYSTRDTLKTAFRLIGLKKDANIISSYFVMLVGEKVFLFADCAVNISPNPEELSEIAQATSENAQMLGLKPKVGFLSYSTGESGAGEGVLKVKQAQELFKKQTPFPADGPVQFDAALVPEVAKKKLPNSELKGRANVLIFPNLDSGNITYKAVQRMSNGFAVGPILQGMKQPFNDLSRGAKVEDIVMTLVLTALGS